MFHKDVVGKTTVSFLQGPNGLTAEMPLKILGKETLVRVLLNSIEKPYTMRTHIFGYDPLFTNSDGDNIGDIIGKFKERMIGNHGSYGGGATKSVSFALPSSSGSYEYDLELWIPKMTRAINDAFKYDYFVHKSLVNKDKILIVGLGGTGMRIAELIDKSDNRSIVLIDPDKIEEKNLMRLPLNNQSINKYKVDEAKNLMPNTKNIEVIRTTIQDAELDYSDIDFAFLSIDNGDARKYAIDILNKNGIEYIDAGVWIRNKMGTNSYRFASRTSSKHDVEPVIEDDGDYKVNIQFAEINSFNAAQAVVHYKTLKGFYHSNDMKDRIKIGAGLERE